MVRTGYVRNSVYGMGLLVVSLTTGCAETLLSEDSHNCSKNRYQELIGSYKGQVKAILWESDKHETQRNSCLWSVTVDIDATNPDSVKRSCDLRVFKLESELIEQINVDSGDHTCVEILDQSQQSLQHDDSHEWRITDADLPFVNAYSFHVFTSNKVSDNSTAIEAYHPYTEDTGKYITPVTGSYSTFKRNSRDGTVTSYRIQKEIDGSMSFTDWANYSKDSSYAVPEATLSGALLKQ